MDKKWEKNSRKVREKCEKSERKMREKWEKGQGGRTDVFCQFVK